MKMIKLMAYATLATVCAVGFSGCSKKDSSVEEPSKVDTAKLDVSRPKVADGFSLAAMVRAPESTPFKPLCGKHGLTVSDLIARIPEPAQLMVQMLGVDKATFNWVSVSLGGEFGEGKVPDFAVAIATNLDLDQLITDLQKLDEGEAKKTKCTKTTIAGVPAYEIEDGEAPKVFTASLGGKLIVIGSSSSILEKQLFLYCGGKGEKSGFSTFGQDGNVIICVKAGNLGESLKKMLPPDAFKEIARMVPDGEKLVQGLGTVEVALAASNDGQNVKLDITVETSSVEDAKKVLDIVNQIRENATAAVNRGNKDVKMVADILRTSKIRAEDKVAKLSAQMPAEPIFSHISDLLK